MTFMFGPARLIKGENQYAEFREQYKALLEKAIAVAQRYWPGFEFGGVLPGAQQFGITELLPNQIYGGGTATYVKRYGSTGSWCNIFSYTVPQDQIHAFVGLAFTDPTLVFSHVRWELEDRKYPKVNIEEAHGWDTPFGIVFKADKEEELVVAEKMPVLIKGFQERNTSAINQRIVPIGFMLYRRKDVAILEKETGN